MAEEKHSQKTVEKSRNIALETTMSLKMETQKVFFIEQESTKYIWKEWGSSVTFDFC